MPPRGRPRGSTRAASRSSLTPAPGGNNNANDNDNGNGSPSQQQRQDPTLRRTPGSVRMSPGPSMFSSSYGSPAPLPSTRSFVAGRSAVSALGSALQTVQEANQQDRDNTTARPPPRAAAAGGNKRAGPQKTAAAAPSRANSAAPNRGGDDDGGNDDAGVIDDGDDAGDSRVMPPPPRPNSTAPNKRAASTQPASLKAATRSQQANRLGSEPPSDNRSFIEESQVFRGAKFSSPRTQASASPLSSARAATQGTITRDSSVEMSPSKGRGAASTERPITASDSIDEDDSEDPLNTPRRRGVREQSWQPPNSDASRGWTRPESVQRVTESREPASPSPSSQRPGPSRTAPGSGRTPNMRERIRLARVPGDDYDDDDSSGKSDGEPATKATRVLFPRGNGDGKRPNLVQDARFGDLALPRPDQPGTQPNLFRPIDRAQPDPRSKTAADAPAASSYRPSDRAKSPMVDSPARKPSQPPSRPPTQKQLDPPTAPQPQSQAQSRPSLLLQSPPRRPIIQSRPERPITEPRAGGSSSGANAPQPNDNAPSKPPQPNANAPSNPPANSQRRDEAKADSAGQRSGPANPAPDVPRAVPRDPAPEESRFAAFLNDLGARKYEDVLNQVYKWSWLLLKIWAVLAATSIVYLVFIDTLFPIKSWEGIDVYRDFDDGGVVSWRQKFLQIIPWVVLHPFSVLTGNLDYADYRTVLHGLDMGIRSHDKRLSSVSAATWQMRRVLPELIKVNIKSSTGEWAVDDEFWNALDAEMHEGGLMYSLLTLDKADNGTYSISDPHWSAIKQRLQRDHMLSDRPASGGDPLALSAEVVEYVDQQTSKVWAKWLKDNQDAIDKMQGQPGKTPSRIYQELYGDIEEVMNKRLKALGLEQGVVTRDEFLAKFEDSVASHKSEIKTELERLDYRLSQALDIARKAKAAADGPMSVTRGDVEEMIDQAMRRAISDAVLEAIAKGHVKAHLTADMVHKQNYFNSRRGAIIDPDVTSTTFSWAPRADTEHQPEYEYDWLGRKKPKKVIYRKGGGAMGQPASPGNVLEGWSEDGECWCAALANGKNDSSSPSSAPADVGIFTAESVIPRHLVVEHIEPGASFDPKSMPHDIEFWMRVPEDKRARTLAHWSMERFPALRRPDAASRGLLAKGYAKIGEFTYDDTLGKGESQVLRFSEDLVGMDAQTKQVLVRATTNYGAEDHTCFYRLRLFGEGPSTPPTPLAEEDEEDE